MQLQLPHERCAAGPPSCSSRCLPRRPPPRPRSGCLRGQLRITAEQRRGLSSCNLARPFQHYSASQNSTCQHHSACIQACTLQHRPLTLSCGRCPVQSSSRRCPEHRPLDRRKRGLWLASAAAGAASPAPDGDAVEPLAAADDEHDSSGSAQTAQTDLNSVHATKVCALL